MELATLRDHIRTLAALPDTGDTVISCTVDLSDGRLEARNALAARAQELVTAAPEPERDQLRAAFRAIQIYLDGTHAAGTKGLAIYCRAGEHSFFLPLAFELPLAHWVSLDTVPSIYPLVELKDTYHRFVVLQATESQAFIYEVNLGAVTEQLWMERPELRQRVGREWTRLHYRNLRRDQDRRFLKEAFATVRERMGAGGYAHLVLAGSKGAVGELRKALPGDLRGKLVDLVRVGHDPGVNEVVAATLSAFVEAEQRESRSALEQLVDGFYKHDLAVLGRAQSLQALNRGRVSMLVIDKEGEDADAHVCQECGWVAIGDPHPQVCAECPSTQLVTRSVRDELVRVAYAKDCPVETVSGAEELKGFGGVGVMLRYADPYSRATEEDAHALSA